MSNPVPRRGILALLGLGSAVATSRALTGNAEAAAPSAARTVAMRENLAHITAAPGEVWFIADGPGAGSWRWRAGNHDDQVRADLLQGLTLAHATISPKKGAWVREWDGAYGRAEWFGAVVNQRDVDCQPAIQAALDLCPAVQLGAGIYHTRSRILILKNATHLLGMGMAQDQGENLRATQIVCSSPTDTILQVGSDSARQPSPLVETVELRDFSVRRDAAPFIPASGLNGAIGIAMRWCVNCHVERVFSTDSARGWYFYGTIENYVTGCSAMRGRSGSDRANDFFIGYHLDYTAPLAANGGNASLYFDHCRAFAGFGEGTPTLVYSAGLRTDYGFVDLYINALETGLIQYGIDGHGDAYSGGESFRTEDLIITNCVFDPGHEACIRLQTADTSAQIQITSNYFAAAEGTSIALADIGGSVSLTANQCFGRVGLHASRVNNLRATNNLYTKHEQPIRLENVTSFHLQDTIHVLAPPSDFAAIRLIDCTRGRIDCIVNGRSSAHAVGVDLAGTGNSLVEVNCTNLQASAFAGGAVSKLIYNGQPVTAVGSFGNNCLAQGIMQ